MSATVYLSGKVIWCGELARTKTSKLMRGVLVARSNDRDDERPPCFVRLFGEYAEAVKIGDTLAAEGELEASLGERRRQTERPPVDHGTVVEADRPCRPAAIRSQQTPCRNRY